MGENTLDDILKNCPKNKIIVDNLINTWLKINNTSYKNIMCSVSGGSDSDIIIDLCKRCDISEKIIYIWFDTGLEYQATKEHLKQLEQKYDIQIVIKRAEKSIPACCRQYGQPFLSKQASEYISRLQKYNFQWEDDTFENLLNKYCRRIAEEDAFDHNQKLKKGVCNHYGNYYKGCCAALKWWCNVWGNKSKFNIQYNKWLKDFMILYPPQFKISNKCCHYAKKIVAKHIKEDYGCDLSIVGVRKAEKGARSSAYKNCFSDNDGKADEYRPIFWYKNSDKEDYEKHYEIVHSRCYTEYGLKRTGCAGCPYGRDFEQELEIIQKHEPKLFIAVNNIFSDSYEYTRKYREFCKMMDKKKRNK